MSLYINIDRTIAAIESAQIALNVANNRQDRRIEALRQMLLNRNNAEDVALVVKIDTGEWPSIEEMPPHKQSSPYWLHGPFLLGQCESCLAFTYDGRYQYTRYIHMYAKDGVCGQAEICDGCLGGESCLSDSIIK